MVSRHFSVSRTDLVSNQRTRSAVWARRIGMYLARNLRAGTVPEIGRRFGGRDEAAVLRAVRKVETEIGKNPGFREKIEALKRAL